MEVPLGDTYYFLFTTRRFSTGAPFTLAGTPALSVYEENNLTEITTGVAVTADYDSKTGLNEASVVATAANGYEVGKYYSVVITTGTVDSVSVVGEVVGHFRVMPAEDAGAGIRDVNLTHIDDAANSTSTAQLGVNVVNAAGTAWGSGAITTASFSTGAITQAVLATNCISSLELDSSAITEIRDGILADSTAFNGADIAAILVDTGAIETDTQDIQSRLPAALVSGRMSSDMVAISGSTTAADNLEESAEAIIPGTAQTGTLSTTQCSTDLTGYADDELVNRVIVFKSGTANGQAAQITAYANTNGVVTFQEIQTAPVNGDLFVIV